MLLNNYKKLKYGLMYWVSASGISPNTERGDYGYPATIPLVKDISGNEYTKATPYAYRSGSSNTQISPNSFSPLENGSSTSYWHGFRPRIGTGTTAVSADDYQLTNDITSSISNLVYTRQVVYDNDNVKITGNISGVNASGNDITLSEFGITMFCYMGSSTAWGNYNTAKDILIIKEVLSTPVNVPNGSSFSINFDIINLM